MERRRGKPNQEYVQGSLLGPIDVFTAPKPPKAQPEATAIREALAPYIDVKKLRRLASNGQFLDAALKEGELPEEVTWLLSMLAVVLRPSNREQITSPADLAPMLMVEMSHLTQEQLRVV